MSIAAPLCSNCWDLIALNIYKVKAKENLETVWVGYGVRKSEMRREKS